MRDCICLCFPIDGPNDTDKLLASLHLMGIYFGRHTAQSPASGQMSQMSPPVQAGADTDHVGCQVAPHSRHPGLQQVLAPGSGPDQVQGWRAAWLPKLPLVPSFHLLPAKFWNLFHIMNMSGVCPPVYTGSCLRSITASEPHMSVSVSEKSGINAAYLNYCHYSRLPSQSV